MKTIETNRMILRAPSATDVDDIFAYAQNVNVGPAAGWKPHQTKEETAAIIQYFIKNQDVWILEYKANKKAIGTIGLHKKIGNSSRDIGYVLSDAYWNMGLATEACLALIDYAFHVLEVDVLTCSHFSYNEASKRVILKCGFEYVNTIEGGFTRFDGEILDLCNYQLRKENYKGVK